jgi:polyisoprenoid-binding protein YceI
MNWKYIIPLILICNAAIAQQADTQFFCKDGFVHFFSSSPLEDIEAKSNTVVAVYNTTKNEVGAKISIKSFSFKDKLMEEHFNENYLESDKYPFATLTGKIAEPIDLSKDGTYNATVNATLEIHGVKQVRGIKCTFTVKGEQIIVKSVFEVKLADYKIKIPKMVVMNIAETIKVDLLFTLKK